MINITVICPVYNEEKYISSFIESIILQDYNLGRVELLIIDGLSTDRTRDIVKKYMSINSNIKLIDNYKQTVSHALNLGIDIAEGEYIIRVDAHAEFPTDYFSSLIYYSKKMGADNVGGLITTVPVNESIEAVAISIALGHAFGMGNSYFRIGSDKIIEVDTVPFGCFKSDLFKKVGLFDIDLIRNQDDEFNGRILKNNGRIYLIPNIKIKYFARDSIAKISNMFWQYGVFKPLVNKKLGRPTTLRQFVPLCFVIVLIMGIALCFLFKLFIIPYIVFISLYFFISFKISLLESIRRKKMGILFILPVVFFVIHFSYGVGYIYGIYHFILQKKNNLSVKNNR